MPFAGMKKPHFNDYLQGVFQITGRMCFQATAPHLEQRGKGDGNRSLGSCEA